MALLQKKALTSTGSKVAFAPSRVRPGPSWLIARPARLAQLNRLVNGLSDVDISRLRIDKMSRFGMGQAGVGLRVRTAEEESCVGKVMSEEWPQRWSTGTDHGDVQLDDAVRRVSSHGRGAKEHKGIVPRKTYVHFRVI